MSKVNFAPLEMKELEEHYYHLLAPCKTSVLTATNISRILLTLQERLDRQNTDFSLAAQILASVFTLLKDLQFADEAGFPCPKHLHDPAACIDLHLELIPYYRYPVKPLKDQRHLHHGCQLIAEHNRRKYLPF
jgi:hypothetical protein